MNDEVFYRRKLIILFTKSLLCYAWCRSTPQYSSDKKNKNSQSTEQVILKGFYVPEFLKVSF